MNRFDGKIAIVTGAAGGIGRAVALKLAELGVSITVVDIEEAGGKKTVQLIEEKGGQAIYVKSNVASLSDVKNYVEQTIHHFGRIDLFFNNAGIVGSTTKLHEQSDEQIDQTIDINLKGAIYAMKYVIAEMLEGGGGAIVCTSSGGGLGGASGMSSYSASKHGVIGLTKSTALEYASENIKINAIAPGIIDTPMNENLDPTTLEKFESSVPMGRIGKMEEAADVVIYLFSDYASYLTGTVIPVDGGLTAEE